MTQKKKALSGLASRFLLVIEIVGYTNSRLVKEMDVVSNPILNHIRTGRNDPSTKIITALLKKFPTINARWLITGEGQPIYDDIRTDKVAEDMNYSQILHRVPFAEIINYIHEYQDLRKSDTNAIFKGFLESYIQDKIKEGLEALTAKVDRLEKQKNKS